jgi:hypothetical protein
MEEKSDIIKQVCTHVSNHDLEGAKKIVNERYPFDFVIREGRKYTEYQALKLFIRDGFIDRYTGKKLVFPGTLKLLSLMMPNELPYHKNWKMDECHIMYWELMPTIDHIEPIARGGEDNESNWISTSFIKNSAKSNFTLEELDWSILPAGDMIEWDGMLSWFIEIVGKYDEYLKDAYIHKWYKAVRKIENEKK